MNNVSNNSDVPFNSELSDKYEELAAAVELLVDSPPETINAYRKLLERALFELNEVKYKLTSLD